MRVSPPYKRIRKEEKTDPSKMPNEYDVGSFFISSGCITFLVHTARPRSSSNVAFGNFAVCATCGQRIPLKQQDAADSLFLSAATMARSAASNAFPS